MIGEISNEEFDWTVTLRDGRKVDARDAIVGLKSLDRLLTNKPDVFGQLMQLHAGEITADQLDSDVREAFAPAGGTMWETVMKPMIETAVVKNGDKFDLTDPFEDNRHNEFVLGELEARSKRWRSQLKEESLRRREERNR